MMIPKTVTNAAANIAKDKFSRLILSPLNDSFDATIADTFSTIGNFIVKSVQGKWARMITLSTATYTDKWMEDALYAVLYQYNDIARNPRLDLKSIPRDRNNVYYRLADGTHNLRYRNYKILLVVKSIVNANPSYSRPVSKEYNVITYSLDPGFVTSFEADMIACRNNIMKMKPDSKIIQLWKDSHENDGTTYWNKAGTIPKRRLSTIYLPSVQKKQLVDTINRFLSSKEYYHEQGIPWNLKILLEGPPGTGKDSIARMIASEWNRQIFYVSGGKNSKFIPDAISDPDEDMVEPMLLISDIDKVPFVINEENIDISKDKDVKDTSIEHKQIFGKMINALDGAMSEEGRIIVMTTNHIEKFSKTLLRPGRIDLQMHIGYADVEVVRYYVRNMYKRLLPADIQLKSNKTTVAEMQFHAMTLNKPYEEFIEQFVKMPVDKK